MHSSITVFIYQVQNRDFKQAQNSKESSEGTAKHSKDPVQEAVDGYVSSLYEVAHALDATLMPYADVTLHADARTPQSI